jgi:hypothetical protein
LLLLLAGGKLFMGGLPAPGVQYAAGEDSDDPDAAEAAGGTATAVAPDMGKVGYAGCDSIEWPSTAEHQSTQ